MIVALLLAAGASRRFGAPKLLQEIDGKALVRWSVEALRHPLVHAIVVVVPPEHSQIRRALEGLDVRFVVNPYPERGMGSSIASGISSIDADTQAVLVTLADEPMASRTALERVVERYRVGGVRIVVPTFRGTRGHPVLFDRSVFGELLTGGGRLSSDRGARDVTDKDPGRVAMVELNDPKPIDVDTREDLARARAARTAGSSASLIDAYMPVFDMRASYSTNLNVPAVIVYRAVLETNLADSLIAKSLMLMRSLGRRRFSSFRFRDLPDRGVFFLLGSAHPREVVAGVMGRFWSLRGNVWEGDRESFAAPLAPGTAKAVWNFRVTETSTGSRLTTETRVLCADDESRKKFKRYWAVVGPFSGMIRMEALRLIRRQTHYMSSTTSQYS